jgi:uncharacterized membrane protein
LAISPALSLLLIPVFAVASSTVIGRFVPQVVVGLLAAFVLIGCAAAAFRRSRAPVADRFALPVERWLRARWFDTERPRELASTVLLVVSIVVATSMIGYAAVDQNGDAAFTGMHLATESSDGEYRLANYPETLTAGEPTTLHVGLENNEGRTTTYNVVVLVQRVDASGPETVVLSQRELDRASATLEARGTAHVETTVTPTRLGTDLRLTYLLYRGQPAENPSLQSAYDHTYIWVDVVESGS